MEETRTLHRDYLNEIEKLKEIARLQYENELIKMEEYNTILFSLYDKANYYKKNIGKITFPKIEIKNFQNVNVLTIIDSLLCTG